MLRVHPAADGPTDHLAERVRVAGSVGGRLRDRLGDLRTDVVEDRVVLGEATRLDLRSDDALAGGEVHGAEDGDEPLLRQDATVLEVGVGDLADGRAVHVHVPDVELTRHRDLAVLQVDDDAVLPEDDVPRRHARLDREVRVGVQVAVLAVHGQHVLRPQDVVAVQQLAGRGVSGDVDLRVALVHHLRAELRQPVDHAVDGVLVARDEARRQDDGVALADLDLVLEVRHAREDGHRFALRPGRHVDDLVVGDVLRLLRVDEHVLGHPQVAELGGDRHVPDHRPAHEGDLAVRGGRGVEDLLHAVHVRREARDDDLLAGARDDVLEDRSDVALRGGEARHVGVGRVRQEQVDALLAEPREGTEIGDAVVERELVHLEVARVQDPTGGGRDRDGEGVRDGVVHGDELEVERAELLGLVLLHDERVGLDPVLLELRLDECERQGGADQGDVALELEQVRHGADVVLVPVGEHDAEDVVEAVPDRPEVGEDEVDARLVLLGEEHAGVDDEQLAVELVHGHVATDLAETPDGDHAEGAGFERLRCGDLGGHSVLTVVRRAPGEPRSS
ncbi:hypothetical protein Cus16_3142 [Curtobacterium sp. ER1/6]|nr:hypothetical protein Cus16_3142 [Curtobacterium sp. ER1/6]